MYRVKANRYQDVNTLYRADPCCHLGFKERHDWALFNTNLGKRVGQILSFIRMDTEMIKVYNSNTTKDLGNIQDNESGDYSVVQLLSKEIPGLVDPTFRKHHPDNVMQANSTLVFYGKKQLRKNGEPITRLLPLYKIVCPLVVLPDVHPSFSSPASGCQILKLNINEERNHSFMVLRPRHLWHKVFLEQAIHFKPRGGVDSYTKRMTTRAYAKAEEEEKEMLTKKENSKRKKKKPGRRRRQRKRRSWRLAKQMSNY